MSVLTDVTSLARVAELPEARASLAVRTAFACTVCSLLIFLPLPEEVRRWFPASVCSLAVQMCYICCFQERGDTMRLSMVVMLSPVFLIALATGVCSFIFWVAPYQWNRWVLLASMPLMAYFLVIWGKVAQELHKPRWMMVAPLPAVWHFALVPVLMFREQAPTPWTSVMTGVTLATLFVIGSGVALLSAYLPCPIGAPPSRRRLPALLAAKLYAVAEFLEATTLLRGDAAASWTKCREALLEALRATAAVNRATTAAKVERWMLEGHHPIVDVLEKDAEKCRLGVQLMHFMESCRSQIRAGDGGDLVAQVMTRGPLGEVMFELTLASSHALRLSAQLLAERGSGQAVNVATEGFDGSSHELRQDRASVEACMKAAMTCEDALDKFRQKWEQFVRDGWRERVMAVYGENAEQFFTDRAIFDQVCLSAATHLAICQIAEAALVAARGAVEAVRVSAFKSAVCLERRRLEHSSSDVHSSHSTSTGDSSEPPSVGMTQSVLSAPFRRTQPNGLGLHAWLRAPIAGRQAWLDARRSSWGYATRLATATLIAGALAALHPGSFVDPSLNPIVTPGLWVMVTTGLCLVPRQGAAILKGRHRFFGTVVGAFLGLLSRLLANGDPRAVLLQVPLVILMVKFFDKELKYVGTVCIITYTVIISEGFDLTMLQLGEVSLERVLCIFTGVGISVVVSICVAPDIAVSSLRELELEALRAVSETASIISAAFSSAVRLGSEESTRTTRTRAETGTVVGPEPTLRTSMTVGRLSSLRSRAFTWVAAARASMRVRQPRERPLVALRVKLWKLQAKLFFQSNPLSGNDLLSDVQWEAHVGSDKGKILCDGLIRLPGPCFGRDLVSASKCLRALPAINQAIQITYMLAALLEPEVSEGVGRVLTQELVAQTMGRFDGMAVCIEGAVSALAPLFVKTAKPTQGDMDMAEEDSWSAEVRSSRLPTNLAPKEYLEKAAGALQRLRDGVAEQRANVGGAIGPEGTARLGGVQVMASLALMNQVLARLELARRHLQESSKGGSSGERRGSSSSSSEEEDASYEVEGSSSDDAMV